MKVGIIARSNEKGQIVIPKEVRAKLGISANMPLNVVVKGQSICIYPIASLVSTAEKEFSYLKILERTKGSWVKEPWEKVSVERKKLELKASLQRKQAW